MDNGDQSSINNTGHANAARNKQISLFAIILLLNHKQDETKMPNQLLHNTITIYTYTNHVNELIYLANLPIQQQQCKYVRYCTYKTKNNLQARRYPFILSLAPSEF